MDLIQYKDPETQGRQLAIEFIERINKLHQHQEWVNAVITGGTSTAHFYRFLFELGKGKVNWSKVRLFLSDERYISPYDTRHNSSPIKAKLIEPLGVGEYIDFNYTSDLDKDLASNNAKLEPIFQAIPQLDLVVLGMGADGHFASLFTTEQFKASFDSLVVRTVDPSGLTRLSLSMKFFSKASEFNFIFANEDKRALVEKLMQGAELNMSIEELSKVCNNLKFHSA